MRWVVTLGVMLLAPRLGEAGAWYYKWSCAGACAPGRLAIRGVSPGYASQEMCEHERWNDPRRHEFIGLGNLGGLTSCEEYEHAPSADDVGVRGSTRPIPRQRFSLAVLGGPGWRVRDATTEQVGTSTVGVELNFVAGARPLLGLEMGVAAHRSAISHPRWGVEPFPVFFIPLTLDVSSTPAIVRARKVELRLELGADLGFLFRSDQVTTLAPELVDTLVAIGQRMEDVTKHMGVNEQLVVGYVDQTYTGRITADGVRFTIDTTTTDHVFADHGIADAVAEGVYLRFESESRLTISEHTLALPYGQIARLALDAAVIPTIDASATGLADLLDNAVDCQGVGASVANALGFGSPALYAGACLAGLDQAADSIYDQLIAAEMMLDLHLTGTARAADTNQDRKIDKLQAGEWTGSMTYDTNDAPLAQPATFVGARL